MRRLYGVGAALAALLACLGIETLGAGAAAAATTRAERAVFQRHIVDRRAQINPRFKKVPRRETRYIIVHTSEAGLSNTLRTVLKGKRVHGGRRTRGGHAHYVIARDGRTYRTLDKRYRADHAGRSMWNGTRNLSNVSLGIELVGWHHGKITKAQYRSLELLLDILQRIYRIEDRNVLTHSQVAYGGPNPWFRRNHRGRKRCARNLDRERAGLGPTWAYDPDVRAGRLQADPSLAGFFYGPKARRKAPAATASTRSHAGAATATAVTDWAKLPRITAHTTAWTIAGGDYDAPTTLYRLPDGRTIPGDRIAARVGWQRLPPGTRVRLASEPEADSEDTVAESAPKTPAGRDAKTAPIRVVAAGRGAWDYVGEAYASPHTWYFFPNGRVRNGSQIRNWDGLPPRTRILPGYRGPFTVTPSRPAITIAGNAYRAPTTLYWFRDGRLVPGNRIGDFRRLPRGVRVFLPMRDAPGDVVASRGT